MHRVRQAIQFTFSRFPRFLTCASAYSGGTGMITMGFKAGTGNASRVIDSVKIDSEGNKQSVKYTLAALVQSNFGGARFLTVNGVPVGRILADSAAAAQKAGPADGPEGSIIVVVATDAPLIPVQLQRIAKRATVGVARSECPVQVYR